MTIKDVAKAYGITESSLRYYEQIGLLKPIKRINGIRVYDEEDLERIKRIICLRYGGLTIEEIQRYLLLLRKDIKAEEEMLKILLDQKERLLKQKNLIDDALEYLDIEIKKYIK